MTDTKYDIKAFENTEFSKLNVLVLETSNNEVYFIAKEVAEALGYAEYKKAIKKHIDAEDKILVTKAQISKGVKTYPLENIPNRGFTCINESGLYSLILSSKLPSAKKFKHWVTSEVLPSIRKTGGYVSNEDLFLKTYLPYADEQTKIMFKTQLATIKHLNDKVGELTVANAELSNTNAALTEKINTWDMRNVLNALVRSWGTVCRNGDMKFTWNSIYKKLNYALNINVYGRKKAKDQTWLDVLSEKELSEAVKVVAALCEATNINVGKIVGKTNKQIIDDLPDIVIT